ncbi:hypothetical protein F7725_027225, partial [Dissostichus mawsoni]
MIPASGSLLCSHLKSDLMHQLDGHVNDFMDSLMETSSSLESAPLPASFSPPLYFRPPHGEGKQFVSRRSLLDELFEVNHIRTIYHMFIALLILFILSTLVVLLVYAFGQLPLVVCTWICMFLSVLLVPYTVAQTQRGSRPHFCSVLFGSVFLLFQALGVGFLPTFVVLTNSFPPASCFIVILEQVLGCLFYAYYVFVRLCIPQFRSSSRVLVLFLGFFAFLHCWLNAFAEMLCFADRMFYKMSQKRFRPAAMLFVFTVSAVVHEYILAICFGFFYTRPLLPLHVLR